MAIEESTTSSSGAMIMLTSTNYTLWKPRMEDLLSCKDLFDPIELKGANPDPAKEIEWKKLNRKSIGHIRKWIDQSVFHHVAQETDAYMSRPEFRTQTRPARTRSESGRRRARPSASQCKGLPILPPDHLGPELPCVGTEVRA
ncbi:hypothetical protein ACHQM5_025767 [Ranunculus cassubicifolius]